MLQRPGLIVRGCHIVRLHSMMLRPAAIVAAACSCTISQGQVPTITNLGVLPGGTFANASAVSADGTAVTGTSGSFDNNRAFRWTAATGIQNLGVLNGTELNSYGYAISADGSAVVGRSGSYYGARPFRWTAEGGLEDLGLFPGTSYSSAFGISGDGLTVVGGTLERGFRWTVGGGIQDLGLPSGSTGGKFPTIFGSFVNAISRDGSTIIGDTWYNAWDGDPSFVSWLLNSSGWGPLDPLSNASGVSANGSAVVGTSIEGYSWDPVSRAWRWTISAGYENLGTIPGAYHSSGSAISGDGLTVGGTSDAHAFIWKNTLGMVDLNTYLPSLGLNLSGWVLREARGLNADGSVIVGYGTYQGQTRAWIVRIPRPGDVTGDGKVNVDDLHAVIAALGACPPSPQACPEDIAPPPLGNGIVNAQDILRVVHNFH